MPTIVAGQLQRNRATGKLYRDKTTGKIRRNKDGTQGICCCTGNCACGNTLAGSLPSVIKATFVGVNIPGGCIYSETIFSSGGIESSSFKYVSVPINGTFCLTKVANSCVWIATAPADFESWVSSGSGGVCLCGTNYGVDCGFHEIFDQITIILVPSWDGAGAVPYIEVYPSHSSGERGILFGDYPFWAFPPGSYLPCNGTMTVNNQATYYQTMIFDYIHMQSITDPGGVCNFNTSICPPAPGFSFGGHVNLDTTGAACP